MLLHSFAHALMRQFSLEAGYSAASLKERVYARPAGVVGGPMAGVLIYTSASDSEGTLGGLIGLGENEDTLYQLIRQSLESVSSVQAIQFVPNALWTRKDVPSMLRRVTRVCSRQRHRANVGIAIWIAQFSLKRWIVNDIHWPSSVSTLMTDTLLDDLQHLIQIAPPEIIFADSAATRLIRRGGIRQARVHCHRSTLQI
ncbi:MAG: DUF1998 domain-containing protein [Chloroflexi bacterium]|nr:DUF1998 domain-containing protein [Chloroflexota bacterium]